MQLGIVNADDMLDLEYHLTQNAKQEHRTAEFEETIEENSGKLVILINAFHALKDSINEEIPDLENTVLLAYIGGLLSFKYKIRLYIVDPTFRQSDEDWIDFFDSLFDNFTKENYHKYRDVIWRPMGNHFTYTRWNRREKMIR